SRRSNAWSGNTSSACCTHAMATSLKPRACSASTGARCSESYAECRGCAEPASAPSDFPSHFAPASARPSLPRLLAAGSAAAPQCRRKRMFDGSRRTPLCFAVLSLLLGACAGSSEGGTHVRLVSEGAALSEGQELGTAGAGRLRVDALRWTTSEVELVGC